MGDQGQSSKKQQVGINSGTDTGGYFEVGNISIAFKESAVACVPSAIVAFLAIAARATYEVRHTGLNAPIIQEIKTRLEASRITNNPITNNRLTRWAGKKVSKLFNKMVGNPNVGLEVSAAGLAISSAIIPIQAAITGDTSTMDTLFSWGQEETILGTAALANALNGSSTRIGNVTAQNSMKAVGTIAASLPTFMTSGEFKDVTNLITAQPEAFSEPRSLVYGVLLTGIGQSLWQTVRNVKTGGLLQPQLMLGAGCFANAAICASDGNTNAAVANSLWGIAFISMDAVFKSGGMYQRYFKRNKPDDQQSPEIA